MPTQTKEASKSITILLNGAIISLKNVLPMQHTVSKPKIQGELLQLHYAVLIGFTGDQKGKLILSGDPKVFGTIGEVMFGMPLEGEMLNSFSGELGNMLAGGIATNIVDNGIDTDITAPSILQGQTNLSGYKKAIQLTVNVESAGELTLYLLLDS